MDYKDYNDSELLYLIQEESEEAKDIIFKKYEYLIKIILKKYTLSAKILNIDFNDLYQEALLGFSDALYRYDDNSSSLVTFITLCVDRRLKTVLRKAQTAKSKALNDTLSLELVYEDNQTLLDSLINDSSLDPLKKVSDEENYNSLIKKIKSKLSDREYDVFTLMANNYNISEISKILNRNYKQIDNTSQRIKAKVKQVLQEN